jgi:hypothetical protein
VSDLFRPEDRHTAVTHPERFAFIPDPDDRKFAALAHAAGATLISNDGHLLRHGGHMDLTVLTHSGSFGNASSARTMPKGGCDTAILMQRCGMPVPLSFVRSAARRRLVEEKANHETKRCH